MTDPAKELVRYRLQRADEALHEAHVLADGAIGTRASTGSTTHPISLEPPNQ